MKCTVFNGSPRGEKSNSSVIIRWLLESAVNFPDVSTEAVLLRKTEQHEEYAAKMWESDISIIIFPLYADSMPGLVSAFIEKLQPYLGKMAGKKLGFVIHSGFSEAHHSRYIERYAVWLAQALDADYMGTAIYAGSEATRFMPDKMQKKKKALFNRIGESMFSEGIFDGKAVKKLVRTESLSGFKLLMYKILAKTDILNFYWNSELKKNKAYDNRFARPY
jgi:multimeric flavodoxin WrbA